MRFDFVETWEILCQTNTCDLDHRYNIFIWKANEKLLLCHRPWKVIKPDEEEYFHNDVNVWD